MADGQASQFVRPEHRAIIGALRAADAALLARCRCWFGGDTAIVLAIGEYRFSKDLDFLCADQDGYRVLRSGIAERGASFVFGPAVTQERAFRADQYGIRGIIAHDGLPICFEIVREARIPLIGALGERVHFFNLPLPNALGRSAFYEGFYFWMHLAFGAGIVGLFVLHAAAALQHEFLKRDNVLRRMLGFIPMTAERQAAQDDPTERNQWATKRKSALVDWAERSRK